MMGFWKWALIITGAFVFLLFSVLVYQGKVAKAYWNMFWFVVVLAGLFYLGKILWERMEAGGSWN